MNSPNQHLRELSCHLACYQAEMNETCDSVLISAIFKGVIELDYYVDSFDELYYEILETLALVEFAPLLASLRLYAPDEGINGTRSWDLEPLASGEGTFDNLKVLDIQGTQPEHHNRTIFGDRDENGIVARLLDKMPNLETLSIPSAPNVEFFHRGEHPLKHLVVQTGYDTQNFILNLAYSRCFCQL